MSKRAKSIIEVVKDYININYDVRFDIISLRYEWKPKSEKTFKDFNENDLYCELLEEGHNVSKDKLLSIINSSWIKHFNPFQQYFNGLPLWDKETDHIANLASYLDVDDKDYFLKHFKKWLVRVVACSLNPDYFNKQMLLFVGAQNNGKSSFQRFLCPNALKEYYSEEMIKGKDELITLTQSFLILSDELSKLEKEGVEHIKQLMTKTRIRFRLPYGKTNTTLFAHASFMGNTNKYEFLRDETGSIRFLCFTLKRINFAYSKEVDMDNIYSQAYTLYKSGFMYELTREEETEIQEYNRKYQALTHEQELLMRFFAPCLKVDEEAIFITSSEVSEELQKISTMKISSESIGKGLRFLQFEADQVRREDKGYPIKGYWVKRINRPKDSFYEKSTYYLLQNDTNV
jgi:predicted P-loop ATPase